MLTKTRDTQKPVLFTTGYEGRTPKELVTLLKQYGINQLVDVRELAISRKKGFAKTALSEILRENNIQYKHLPELGSPRKLRHELRKDKDYEKFFKAYSKTLTTPEARDKLYELNTLARGQQTAIMCFEKDAERCHRKIIYQTLIKSGYSISHL